MIKGLVVARFEFLKTLQQLIALRCHDHQVFGQFIDAVGMRLVLRLKERELIFERVGVG
ncbi:hypothetical protein G6L74_09310 [Agrobacterium tumefaciens]|uniref:hypothetical protein n=1 Tax=Agrobacterium tumefaciens TaxID=358 RepID=UPI0015731378|nr:hypothetical protein [Agrobacterium tumefaciens]